MITLDTHVFIWWISNPEKLSKKAAGRMDKELKTKGEILVSAISVWEIYMLVKKGRLKLTMDIDTWMRKVERISLLRFVPIDNSIAAKSVGLSEFKHNDPADRMIIATALEFGCPLLTSDKKILGYSLVQTIW